MVGDVNKVAVSNGKTYVVRIDNLDGTSKDNYTLEGSINVECFYEIRPRQVEFNWEVNFQDPTYNPGVSKYYQAIATTPISSGTYLALEIKSICT